MPRRKPSAKELIERVDYLRGRQIDCLVECGTSAVLDEGEITDIKADTVNNVPVAVVDFNQIGEQRISLIDKRTPRGLVGNPNVLRLRLGRQPGPYRWDEIDGGPAPPLPNACFRVEIPLWTWPRLAKRRKPKVAMAFAVALGDVIEYWLYQKLEGTAVSVQTTPTSVRHDDDPERFDLAVDIRLYDCEIEQAHHVHGLLLTLLDVKADPNREGWSTLLTTNPDYACIFVNSFSLSGMIGVEQLESVKGRFVFR